MMQAGWDFFQDPAGREFAGTMGSGLAIIHSQLGLLQAPADRGRMDPQMVCNLHEPIPIGSICRVDKPRRRPFLLKQDAQCRSLRLSLPARNVANQPIGLELRGRESFLGGS